MTAVPPARQLTTEPDAAPSIEPAAVPTIEPAAGPATAPGGRRALLVWGVAVVAYFVAVFHRSSLGVAGVEAAARFGVGAALLAMFSVAQLAVYAAMQVPVGLLLDRYGSRRLLIVGATLMAVGQLAFALATDVRPAIAARMLIGVGDSMTFISVLRVVARWFPPRRNPLLVQLTAVLGQLGSLVSAVPLVVLLRGAGWTATYLGAAGFGLAAVVLLALGLRDAPAGPAGPPVPVAPAPRGTVRAAWSQTGTRLGLWTHFATQFSGTVFGLLWGYPFLVDGEGLSQATAALLLSLLTFAVLASGPLIGHLCGRLPYQRSVLVLTIVGSSALVWTVVLLWPGRAPLWLLVVLVLTLAANGPGSAIGFDYARTFNPPRQMGSASGIVNVGGFTASIGLIIGIGVVLDLLGPPGRHHPLSAYRWAFALQYLLWALGAVQVLRYRRAARRELAAWRSAALAPVAGLGPGWVPARSGRRARWRHRCAPAGASAAARRPGPSPWTGRQRGTSAGGTRSAGMEESTMDCIAPGPGAARTRRSGPGLR
jgi:MFS family permease